MDTYPLNNWPKKLLFQVFNAHNIQTAVFSLPAILTTTTKPSSFGCPNQSWHQSWLCNASQGENTVFWIHFMKQRGDRNCWLLIKLRFSIAETNHSHVLSPCGWHSLPLPVPRSLLAQTLSHKDMMSGMPTYLNLYHDINLKRHCTYLKHSKLYSALTCTN